MEYKFNGLDEMNYIVDEIKKYFVTNGPNSKAVIGISGGKDSTIVAALCVKALGKENVIGVLMPQGNGQKETTKLGEEICKYLGIEYGIVDISTSYINLCNLIDVTNERAARNISPRLRMIVLYAYAESINGRVMNTSNASERYLGYCTKWGDMCGDFAPIADYTATEVLAIGSWLNIPEKYLDIPPEDGLSGKTDEEAFGFTYKELDNYISRNIIPNYKTLKAIKERHKASMHKTWGINVPKPCRLYFKNLIV